jgi:transcriptional regulator with XRE-family HTH domain
VGTVTEPRPVDPLIVELTIARQALGYTQAAVSYRMGCSAATVGSYERGDRTPPLDAVRAYAAAVGVDLGVVRPDRLVAASHDMSPDELADALTRLAAEVSARLTEV